MVLSARSFAPDTSTVYVVEAASAAFGVNGRPTSRVVIDASRDGTASLGQRHVDRVGLDGSLKVAFTVVEVATPLAPTRARVQ